MEELHASIKQISLYLLKLHSKYEDIVVEDWSPQSQVFGHWMSLILVSGQKMRITFKVHFMTKAAKYFSCKLYHTSADEVSRLRGIDFFKEYCNLTAGQIKASMAQSGVMVAISLPALARGFDEVFYTPPKGSEFNGWKLRSGETHVICTTHVELFEQISIKLWDDNQQSSVGDIDYL